MILPSLHKRFFYRNFRSYFRSKERWQRRFTRAGKFLLIALMVAAIVGVNTRQAVAYQITGFLFALIGIALLSARRFKPALRVQRDLPRYATVGVPFSYRLQLSLAASAPISSGLAPAASPGAKNGVDQPTASAIPAAATGPVQGIYLFEVPHDPRPSFEQFCTVSEPGAAQRNWFDRNVGYYRWAWLVRLNAVARIDEIVVPPLPIDGTLHLTHRCTPHARGVLNLQGIAIARRDVFGLCRAYRIVPLPGSVLVLPRTYRLPRLDLPGTLHAQPEHRVASNHHGDGEEIAGLREYRPGDALRDIHWKSFARLGTPVVKEYQAEYAERHALLLDTSGAPAGEAFEDAVALAASLVGDIGHGECLLDLLFVGNQTHCFTMGPGELQAEALLRVLAGVYACPGESLQPLLANIGSRRAELSGCVCLLLAWDEERSQMIAQLQKLGLPLLVWLVSAQRPAGCPPWVSHFQPGRIEQGLAQL